MNGFDKLMTNFKIAVCENSCRFCYPNGMQVKWEESLFSTTITAATVITIVNTDLSTTRYSTVYNELPAGYTLPTNTNADGTQTVLVTYSRTGQELTTEL